ncbi:MAG: DNA-formamidopyrimidine glycosylase [Leptolyngbyaceae cyanobacterium bins.349]|nr:DNA-formamidopyrimidine glycosylase [Leptolyngbyaceae cyanobacterium bins.349]
MPELPEVETVKRGLNQVTQNQTITGGDVLLNRTIAHPSSMQEFLDGLKGQAIAQWHRRGKYLLAELQSSDSGGLKNLQNLPSPAYLGVHLRMTGQLLWVTPEVPLHKHTRVRLFFEGDRELRFVDQRTFGQMWWVPAGVAPETIITGLQALGPEPFSDEFSIAYFSDRLKNRQRPIKNALLDQAIVAGIGNIYADEALFMTGIRPQKLCNRLTHQQIQQLRDNIVKVLEISIEAKGTTFDSFRSVEGINGNYGGMAWVYARDGEPCRNCGSVIERLRLAGRSAHFCPKCQQ